MKELQFCYRINKKDFVICGYYSKKYKEWEITFTEEELEQFLKDNHIKYIKRKV